MTTLHELTVLRVGFVSLTEALDLTTPGGRAFAGFLAVFAEFERALIREQIKAGISDARTRGKVHGRSRAEPMMPPRFGHWRSKASVKQRLRGTLACVAHVGAADVDAAGGDVREGNAVRRGMGVRKTRDV